MRFEISEVITQDQVMNLVYGNNSTPKHILGRHYLKEGQVIAAYHPYTESIELIKDDGTAFQMDRIERQPVYAIYFQDRTPFHYVLKMTFPDGNTFTTEDPYSFPCQITDQDEELFLNGEWTDAYRKIGCQRMVLNGTEGMYFAVWAPAATRVSIVGDFNYWNGLIYPMNKLEKSGIFELFIPGLSSGSCYKYEIKTLQGNIMQKADPFEYMKEEGDGNASKIIDIDSFPWTDSGWMRSRGYRYTRELPLAVCCVGNGDCLPEEDVLDGNFTHILFGNCGKETDDTAEYGHTSLLCPPYCGNDADSFRSMIDFAHRKGIGVLMEICPGFFSREGDGNEFFDGSLLYGYSDRRIGYDRKKQMWRYCFAKPEVRSLVLSSLNFWYHHFHIDGFVFTGIDDMVSPDVDIFNKIDIKTNLGSDVEVAREVLELPHHNIDFLNSALQTLHSQDISVLLIGEFSPILPSRKNESLSQNFDYFLDHSVGDNIKTYLAHESTTRWKEHYRLVSPLQNQKLESSLVLLNPLNGQAAECEGGHTGAISRSQYQYDPAWLRMAAAFLLGIPGGKIWM